MTALVIYIRAEDDTNHAGTWCDVNDGGVPYVPQYKLTAAEAKLEKAVKALLLAQNLYQIGLTDAP